MIDRTIHWIGSAVLKENYLYCVYRRYNILLRINLISWEYEKIAVLEWDCYDLVTEIYEIDDQIICVPLHGVQIAVYNLKTKEIRYSSAENPEMELINVMIYDHKIWLFPRNLPEKLYYYSLAEEKFFEDSMWEKEVKKFKLYGRVKRKSFTSNNEIYIVVGEKVIRYNLMTQLMTEIIVPRKGTCLDIIRMGEMYYALMETGKRKIFSWNEKDNQIYEIEGNEEGSYIKLTKVGKSVLVDSGENIDILIDGMVRKLGVAKHDNQKTTRFINSIRLNDRWLFLPWGSTEFAECELDFSNINTYKVQISTKDILECGPFLEESDLLLNDYIDGVVTEKEKAVNVEKENGVGWTIYELLKR